MVLDGLLNGLRTQIFIGFRKLNSFVVTDSLLCFCSQEETQHSLPHNGPAHEGEVEEEDLTGIGSCFRRAVDEAQTQSDVDQVGGVKNY